MQYIAHTRFKGKAICGDVNIPASAECECIDNVIYYKGKPICATMSENAHKYFAVNDDGNGMLRGRLTAGIISALGVMDEKHQERWDKVWADNMCKPFKRPEYEDYWLWNHDFYNGNILVLQYIAGLVGVKNDA